MMGLLRNPALREVQWRQILSLSAMILVTGALMVLAPPTASYFLGFAIAAVAVGIALQQLYIYTLVDSVVLLDRKGFYLSASFTLAVLGFAQGLYCLYLILISKVWPWAPSRPDYVAVLRYVAELALPYGLLWLINLLATFFYAGRSKNKRQACLAVNATEDGFWSRAAAWLLVTLRADLTSVNLAAHIPWGWYHAIRSLRSLTMVGLVLCLVFTVATSAGPAMPGFDLGWWDKNRRIFVEFTSVVASVCASLLVLRRLIEVRWSGEASRGFSAFLGLLLIAAIPPVLESLMEAVRRMDWLSPWISASERLSMLAVAIFFLTVGAALLFVVPRFQWMVIVKFFRHLNIKPFCRTRPRALGEKALSQLLGAGFAGLFLILTALMYPIVYETKPPSVPLAIFSFFFFVVGCAYITANDLSHASDAYKTVARDFFSGQFLSMVHHELINPLQPAANFLRSPELRQVLTTPHTDPAAEAARQRAVQRLDYSINGVDRSIGFLHRLKTEGTILNEPDRVTNIFLYVRDFVEGYRGGVLENREQISLDYASCAETVNARIKPLLFTRVLRLLVDNAVEAKAPDRRNDIRIQIDTDTDGKSAIVRVVDTGKGMPAETLERFGQPQMSTKQSGSGIGTATAQRFVESMGGRLTVEQSSPDLGTVIRIVLEPT